MSPSRIPAFMVLPLLSGCLLAGCTVGPNYHAPAVALPPVFSRAPDQGQAMPDLAVWWHAFNDPVLDDLIARGLRGSFDIRQAASRVEQARAQERATRAGGGPKVNASAQGSYNQLSANSLPAALTNLGKAGGGSSPLGLAGEHFTTFQTGFDASWEIDLLGGQRRANEAARARSDASVWSRRDAEVMLVAEIANSYQRYRALQGRLAIMDEMIAAQREEQEIERVRAARGLTTTLDERQGQAQIAQSAATREDLMAQAQGCVHALGTLLGLAPYAVAPDLAKAPKGPAGMIEVPAGLPSQLLERRPDLRAAERRLAAATADIGVATADLYPKFSLTGALQLASRSLTNIVASDSILGNAGGRVSLPVIGGAGRATVQLRKAQAQEALLAYQGDVLAALRDVEDALTRLDADRRRVDSLTQAEAAMRDAADTAAVRFRHGLVNGANVTETRQKWLNARDTLAQAQGAAAQDVVALYKALGGGWDAPEKDGSHG